MTTAWPRSVLDPEPPASVWFIRAAVVEAALLLTLSMFPLIEWIADPGDGWFGSLWIAIFMWLAAPAAALLLVASAHPRWPRITAVMALLPCLWTMHISHLLASVVRDVGYRGVDIAWVIAFNVTAGLAVVIAGLTVAVYVNAWRGGRERRLARDGTSSQRPRARDGDPFRESR